MSWHETSFKLIIYLTHLMWTIWVCKVHLNLYRTFLKVCNYLGTLMWKKHVCMVHLNSIGTPFWVCNMFNTFDVKKIGFIVGIWPHMDWNWNIWIKLKALSSMSFTWHLWCLHFGYVFHSSIHMEPLLVL